MGFIAAVFGIGLGALFMYLYLVEYMGYRKPPAPPPSIDAGRP